MAERLFKIGALALFVLSVASGAYAKDNFVKYSEVKDQIASKPAVAADPAVISSDELRSLLEGGSNVLVFDARSKAEFEKERLSGARLPRHEEYYRQTELFKQQVVRQAPSSKAGLESGMKEFPRDTAIVTYCNKHCGLSKTLMLDLQGLGFTNVRWLDGGIDTWREKGYPLESGNP